MAVLLAMAAAAAEDDSEPLVESLAARPCCLGGRVELLPAAPGNEAAAAVCDAVRAARAAVPSGGGAVLVVVGGCGARLGARIGELPAAHAPRRAVCVPGVGELMRAALFAEASEGQGGGCAVALSPEALHVSFPECELLLLAVPRSAAAALRCVGAALPFAPAVLTAARV